MEIPNNDDARRRLSPPVPTRPDASPRIGGQWEGRVRIAEDFDTLPDDFDETSGMGEPKGARRLDRP